MDVFTQNYLNTIVVSPTSKIINDIKSENSSNPTYQKAVVKKYLPEIEKHNKQYNNKPIITIPVMNLNNNKFKASIIGFDGREHPVRVMLDSGCMCDAVFGYKIGQKAQIKLCSSGTLSTILTLKVQDREILLPIMPKNNQTSWIKKENENNGYVDFINKQIDILIGLDLLKILSNCGVIVSEYVNLPKDPTYVPYYDFECCISDKKNKNIKISSAIDSGYFSNGTHIMVPSYIVNDNPSLFNITMIDRDSCQDIKEARGTIHKFSFEYKNRKFEFDNLIFFANNEKNYGQNKTISCVMSDQFIKLLEEKYNAFPRAI